MKPLAFLLVSLLAANALLGDEQPRFLVRCPDANSKSQWEKVAPDKRRNIENHLLQHYGLSSTGQIELSGIYRLTHSDIIGSKGDMVALLTQEDLFGGRLFWICVVHLTKQESKLLYRVGEQDAGEVIRIQDRAEPGAVPEPPPAAPVRDATETMNPEPQSEAPADSGGR